MRASVLSLASLFASTAALIAEAADAPRPAAPAAKTVYLYSQAALDELRASNPLHYGRAVKILAAAPQLCRIDAPGLVAAAFEARDVRCLRGLLRTSDPPKWELDFRLDEVYYIALVTVTGMQPRFIMPRLAPAAH